MQDKQANSEINVKLKPILGIRPGVYLTILYSFVILLILYILLFSHGIKNPGCALDVKTEPQGAGIRVDGVYMDASGKQGSRFFVSKGTRVIEAVMPGFESSAQVHEIPSRAFGSRFSPRVYSVEFKLTSNDPVSAFALYAEEFAKWSFAGEPTAVWQIPMSLSQGAYRLGDSIDQKDELLEILLAASRFAVTNAALRDLLRAKILLDNGGNAPSPLALAESISDILGFLSQTKGSAEWLTQTLPKELSGLINSSDWIRKYYERQSNTEQRQREDTASLPSRFTLEGLNFIRVPFSEKQLVPSGNFATSVPLFIPFSNNYLISETPVSKSLFETFLNLNPEWKTHTVNTFDEISAIPFETNNNVITNISWYAADAFCKWLSTRLPSSMEGFEVRLPTENEWKFASINDERMLSPIGRNGGWEWTCDHFAPLAWLIPVSGKAAKSISSPERTLAGRPITQANQYYTNGYSLPPEITSPFVTFRPLIAPIK